LYLTSLEEHEQVGNSFDNIEMQTFSEILKTVIENKLILTQNLIVFFCYTLLIRQ